MQTKHIEIRGIVQGVGFRPFIDRLAHDYGLTGTVANRGSYVEVFAQGAQVNSFIAAIPEKAPARSLVMRINQQDIDLPAFDGFTIIESEKEKGDIFVSPDIAICRDCQKELLDPTDKRYLHPFINCTGCGPRLTILDAMPYDRERTSMAEFPLCPHCAFEYTHAETRRYDAQPVCCPDCGPRVRILGTELMDGAAITAARRCLMEGGIVAVKGIGGFHLACDAHNETAIARLRHLKHRPMKPFALMARDKAVVAGIVHYSPAQEQLLDGWQKPILILEKRDDCRLPELLAPGSRTLGIMLPYTPLHILLFSQPDGIAMTDLLVMTSGNASGAPICRTSADAAQEIADFCDIILTHNRKIRLRADDSVMDFREGLLSPVRRSRGYAPLPVMLSGASWKGQVLGIGGELKNAFTLSNNELFYVSSYVGDLGDIRTVTALEESIVRMQELLEISPSVVACDLHPLYNSVRVAEEMNLPLVRVQHHYAHILSCMAENDYDGPVLGVSFDGTGLGTDQTIWGGELLLCDYAGFTRLASLVPFWHAGGDLASRQGWRIASAMLIEKGDDGTLCQRLQICTEQEKNFVQSMIEKKINVIRSTSAGRLFDAVSALLGIRKSSSFEGEASMALQAAAETWRVANSPSFSRPDWPLLLQGKEQFFYNTPKLIEELVERQLAKRDPQESAYFFHKQLASMIIAGCVRAAEETGVKTCALSGGVFQNRLLASLCIHGLEQEGLKVLVHSIVPPNDGGISLGQAACASWRINNT